MAPVLVLVRPVGAKGAEQQPRHDALSVLEVGQGPHEGDEGVRAGVEQVVVPEDPQGRVVGSARPEGHAPRLLALVDAQGVVLS